MTLSSLFTAKHFRSHHHNNFSIQTLIKTGFTPTIHHLNDHLLFLSKTHKFNSILNFFSQITANHHHVKPDSQSYFIFTWALLKTHHFEHAHHFIRTHFTSPQNSMWDSLIQGFCRVRNDPEKAFSVMNDGLESYGILPSSFTFCLLIQSFSSKCKMDRAIQVVNLMTNESIRYPLDNFVSSTIISGFSKIGNPQLAVLFLENAQKNCSIRPNVVTYTALVNALSELGRIRDVDIFVCRMIKEGLVLDVVFYSSWILGYFKHGIPNDAFKTYKQMVDSCVNPDIISYTELIYGFSKEGSVEKSVGILDNMRIDGMEPNLVTYTAFIWGFCKKGKLKEAFSIFNMVKKFGIELDEFSYATLIDGACRIGDFDCVCNLLEEMKSKGFNPSVVTGNIVINGLCLAGRMFEADGISRDITGDVITYTTLLHGYIEEQNIAGILETKKRLEEAAVCMDIIMCNVLMKALFMLGEFENAYKLYKGLPNMNLIANSVTYCTMISGFCNAGKIDEALKIFDEFRRTSISSSACYTCIIHGLCRNDMVVMATEVLFELNEKGLVLDLGTYKMLIQAILEEQSLDGVLNLVYRIANLDPEMYDKVCNNAIYILCKRGYFEAACSVYMTMRMKGSSIASKSYYYILKGLIGKEKEWLNLPFLNSFIKEYGLVESHVQNILIRYMCVKDVEKAILILQNKKSNPTVTFPVTVLKVLTKDGRALDAYKLMTGAKESLLVMDVVDYTNVVDGLCKEGHLTTALDLCNFAQKKGVSLNIITYNSVLNGLCRQGNLVEALRFFHSIERIGLVSSNITYATLIDALCTEGFLQDAKLLFERMICKELSVNIRIYNSLINGYCKFGLVDEASNMLKELEVRCIKPEGFTVSAVIHGYCVKGDMEGALAFFFGSKEKDALPDLLGFVNLTKGLCAKGRMEEARSILREMLSTPSVLEVINQVNTEIETDSIESFLVFLCEQGRIKEAITILDEVRCMVLPSRRGAYSYGSQKSKDVMGDDNLDFSSCYSEIVSFCSKGELHEASRLVKQVILPSST